MDKWYISDNGRVSGPLKIDDVERLIAKNSDLYGWNPTYSHWLPISKINELSKFLPEDHLSEQVSKELIDKFLNRKRDLIKKTTLINASIEKTVEKMTVFEQEIIKYKGLTTSLSEDVQENIVPLEKKYNAIGKQLSELQKALAISKQEINDAVKEFGELVLNKSTENYEDFAELAQTTSVQPTAQVNSTTSEPIKATTTKSTETVKAVEPVASETPKIENNKSVSNIPVALRGTVVEHGTVNKETKPSVVPLRKETAEVSNAAQPLEKPKEAEKMGFKNKLKSVFSKQNNTENTSKLSDRLKMLEKETVANTTQEHIDEEEEVVFLDYDLDSNLDDENDHKKKRRRRRRV